MTKSENFVQRLISRVTLRKVAFGGFVVLAFLALTKLRLFIAYPFPRNSDDANNFLAGIDMANGNWSLHGWMMAPDNLYFTNVLGDAILSRLFGPQPELMFWHGAIVWALLVVAAVFLAARGLGKRASVVAAVTIATLLALTVPLNSQTFSWQTLVSSHAAQILLALLVFALAAVIATTPGKVKISQSVCLALLIFAGSFSDPIFVEMACLPILATCFVRPLTNKRGRAMVVACVLLGFVAARLGIGMFHSHGGFESLPMTISFATFGDVINHLQFAARSLLKLLGADFTGATLDANPFNSAYISILRFPFLFFFVFSMIAASVRLLQRLHSWPDADDADTQSEFIDLLLLFGALLSALAMIVTTAIVDYTHVRYFIPATVFGAILLARRCAQMRLFAFYTAIAFAGSLLFLLNAISQGPRQPVVANDALIQLRDTLQSLGLRQGYAGYWQSSIVSVISRSKIQVLALSPDAASPNRWFTNLGWYKNASATWRGKVFFIATEDPNVPLGLSQKAVVERFGEPERMLRVDRFVIDIYDNAGGSLNLPSD